MEHLQNGNILQFTSRILKKKKIKETNYKKREKFRAQQHTLGYLIGHKNDYVNLLFYTEQNIKIIK